MRQFLKILFVCLIVLSCSRCKEDCDDSTDPACPNYVDSEVADSCEGHQPVTANFVMSERLHEWNGVDTLVPFWTHCTPNDPIVLTALEVGANYLWTIGANTYYTKECSFEIGEEFAGQTLNFTLVVEKDPDLECFPNDNGLDTLTRTVYINDICSPSIIGEFYGSLENAPLDSFPIQFYFEDQIDCETLYISGLVPGDTDLSTVDTYRYTDNLIYFFSYHQPSHAPHGIAFLDSSNQTITVNYSAIVDNTDIESDRINYVFHGYRMN